MQDSKMSDADKKAESILRKWGEIQNNNNKIKSLVKNNPDILRRRLGWFSDYINSFEKEITKILSVVSADYATRLLVTLAKAYYHCAYCKQTLKEVGVTDDVVKMDKCFNKAITFSPTDHVLLSNIAKFYYEAGKYRQAAIHYKNSFSSASNPFAATKAMANAVDAHWSNGDRFLAVFTGIGIPSRFVVSTVRTTVVGGSAGIVNIAKWVVDQCRSSKKENDKKPRTLPPQLEAKKRELLQRQQVKVDDSEIGDTESITAVAPVVADKPTETSAVTLTSSARKKKEKKPPKKRTGNSTATAAPDESESPKPDEKFAGEYLGFGQNNKSSKTHRRKKKPVQQQVDASSESSSESESDAEEINIGWTKERSDMATSELTVTTTSPPTPQQSSVSIAPATVLFALAPIITTDNKQLVAQHSKGKSSPPRDAKTASPPPIISAPLLSEDEKRIKDEVMKLINFEKHTPLDIKAALEKLLVHGKAVANYQNHIKQLPLFRRVSVADDAWLMSVLATADVLSLQKTPPDLNRICAAFMVAGVDNKKVSESCVLILGKDKFANLVNVVREERERCPQYQIAMKVATTTAAAPAKNTMN